MNALTECRACKRRRLYMCLALGDHPPANQFLSEDELDVDEQKAPLDVFVCLDCALIQVPDNVPPDFFRDYVYVPSASPALHVHFDKYAERMVARLPDREGLIVDIGCNDGLLLGACLKRGAKVLGVDPADNITARAREKGIEIVPEYFGARTAKAIVRGHPRAAIVTSNNTFNHIGDLHDFMAGVVEVLRPDGMFVVEVPTALELVLNNEFDTIYHEHTNEFSVKSFVDLYAFFGMEVFDIDPLPNHHGGSMRVYGQKKGARPVAPIVEEWSERERAAKLYSKETYVDFASRVQRIRDELVKMLRDLKRRGARIAGAGAPAKGNTLLNYYGIGPETLDWIADRNELKHGLYTPGMHVPVVGPERILEEQPDYLLVLAWNFADEIIEQQSEYKRRGGKFILPIPEPRIVS